MVKVELSPDKTDDVEQKPAQKKKISLLSDETDFVRGKKVSELSTKKRDAAKVENDNLFTEKSEGPQVKKSRDETELGKPIEELSNKKMEAGSLVLGVVCEIGEVDVVVNLPHGQVGFIRGTEISEEFNTMLETSSDEEDEKESVDLCDVVSLGQYVTCCVLEVVDSGKGKRINLTMKPALVNSNVKSADINKHMVLQGVVSSCEDYGYMVNLGIDGVTGFLNNPENKTLKTCDVVVCRVKSATEGSLILTLYDSSSKPLSGKTITKFSTLLPGHVVSVAVKKHAVNGFKCTFLGGIQGAIHQLHLDGVCSTEKSVQTVYPTKRKCTARVLFINPHNKSVVLSALPHHVALETPTFHYKRGDTIEDLEVVRVAKRGVFIKFDKDVLGFVHLSKLSDKEKVEKVPANCRVGSTHKARIMGFRLADNLVQLSLRASDLAKPFLSYHDITACHVVQCTVFTVEEFGLIVKLADNIRGVVQKHHLADVAIKNPSLKFKPNQKLKAKVLTVDPAKRRLNLTLKRSIVKNSTADVKGYGALEKGQQVTGWVAAIKNFGIIMNFTSNVRGLVHSTEISNVPLTEADIMKLYRIGQVLTCRILYVEESNKKLNLSLNLIEELGGEQQEKVTSRWARKGQIHSCTVMSSKTDGLTVQLDLTKEEAFLPTGHLSDNQSLLQPLLLFHKPGSQLGEVLVTCKRQKKITVSAKPSLLAWVKSHTEMPKISDLSTGDMVPGYIKDFQEYGCFVEIGNGLVGLCPKACLADSFVTNPKEVYKLGDSVTCKITNIDSEKERLLVSLKHSDVSTDPALSGCSLLEAWFQQVSLFGAVVHEEAGTIVDCLITRVTEQGVVVNVGLVPGFAPGNSTGLKVDESAKGVIMDFDLVQKSYIISFDTDMLSRFSSRGKKKKMTEGEEAEVEVVMVTAAYFVVTVPDKGLRMGYVHRRHQQNDLGKSYSDVNCGDKRRAIVHRAKKGKPLLLSFVTDPVPAATPTSRKRSRSEAEEAKEIKLGQVYEIMIKSVKTLQLNVQLGRKVGGRVHITEITDTPESGVSPLSSFKHGDKIQAKLIGFRHSKTHRYLPITRTDYVRSMAEFSLRDSVLGNSKAAKVIEEDEKVDEIGDYVTTLSVGQEVTGFVRSVDHNGFVWISLSPGVEARLWHTLTSTEKADVEGWEEKFHVGHPVQATVWSLRDKRIDLSLVGSLEKGNKLWCQVKEKIPGIGVKLQVSARDWGIVPLTEISDTLVKDPLSALREGTLVQCVVLATPSATSKKLVLSTRKSRLSQRWKKGGRKVTHPAVESVADLQEGTVYLGYVKHVSASSGVWVGLGHGVAGRVLLKNLSDSFLKNWQPMFPLGKLVRVFVLATQPIVDLSMKKTDLKRGAKEEEDEEDTVKCLDDLLMERFRDDSSCEDEEEDVLSGDEEEEVVAEEDAPKIVFTSAPAAPPAGVSLVDAIAPAPPAGEEEEQVSPEHEEEEKKRGKSFAKREKKRKREEAEEDLRRFELRSRDSAPETEDDFERKVAASPDSSTSWVCYMAHWLGLGNVEKARLTAKRALDTINYRLEADKLNVWSALFNLENSFGTPDSLMSTCKEAAAVNDAKAVFQRLAAVLDKSGKHQELDDLNSSVLLKKHKRSRKVWCSYGASLAVQGRLADMREIMTKSLKSLPKHKHIRLISHFAQLEYKYGDANRGSTIFENVLNSYPSRLDLWSVYLDKTISQNEPEQTRLLLDRVIGLKLPAKKMKFFFKRYIDYELAQGDEAKVAAIREKADKFLAESVED